MKLPAAHKWLHFEPLKAQQRLCCWQKHHAGWQHHAQAGSFKLVAWVASPSLVKPKNLMNLPFSVTAPAAFKLNVFWWKHFRNVYFSEIPNVCLNHDWTLLKSSEIHKTLEYTTILLSAAEIHSAQLPSNHFLAGGAARLKVQLSQTVEKLLRTQVKMGGGIFDWNLRAENMGEIYKIYGRYGGLQ